MNTTTDTAATFTPNAVYSVSSLGIHYPIQFNDERTKARLLDGEHVTEWLPVTPTHVDDDNGGWLTDSVIDSNGYAIPISACVPFATNEPMYRATLMQSVVNESFPSYGNISNSEGAANICRNFWDNATIEVLECFGVCYVNKQNKPIAWVELSRGGLDGTVVDLRHLFAHAVLCNASGMVLCHNHPSGNLTPSAADNRTTKQIKDAGDIMQVKLLDHIILTVDSYYSFADNGMI